MTIYHPDIDYDPGVLVTDLQTADGPYADHDLGIWLDRVALGYVTDDTEGEEE